MWKYHIYVKTTSLLLFFYLFSSENVCLLGPNAEVKKEEVKLTKNKIK